MHTRVLSVDALRPDPSAVADAADVLRRGGLVAFPTETVYGLGADALSPAAVARIFAAKGRPSHNPIIVHVADAADAARVAAAWPDTAALLAGRFWPGPLTLVLPRTGAVPDAVTAGGPTVAVRVPAHPVALALLRAAGAPIAAPSANRSAELSPTCAAHVLKGLDGRIDVLLDGGSAPGGIESTVLDLTTAPPRLLRPGLVGPDEIEALVGPIAIGAVEGSPRSPGLLARHYSPRTPLEVVEGDGRRRVEELLIRGERLGWLTFGDGEGPGVLVVRLTPEPARAAAALYAALHRLDEAGLDRLVADLPPDEPRWLAVRDRLRRAAAARMT
jgi:L-threonylcarbamoyladenylate synthase